MQPQFTRVEGADIVMKSSEIVFVVRAHSCEESRPCIGISRSKGRRSTLGRNEFGCIYELRILNRHGRIEETVSRDDVSGGAGLFQHADCGLGDHVVCNDVAVAREKDTGLGAVENVVLTDAGLIALRANAIEYNGGEGFVALDLSIVAVNEDVDLADAGSVAGDLHTVGL